MHYIVLYPQNGDRIVTIDSVTSLHPMYRPTLYSDAAKNPLNPLTSATVTHFIIAKFHYTDPT